MNFIPYFAAQEGLMTSLYPAAVDPNVYKAYIVARLFKEKHYSIVGNAIL